MFGVFLYLFHFLWTAVRFPIVHVIVPLMAILVGRPSLAANKDTVEFIVGSWLLLCLAWWCVCEIYARKKYFQIFFFVLVPLLSSGALIVQNIDSRKPLLSPWAFDTQGKQDAFDTACSVWFAIELVYFCEWAYYRATRMLHVPIHCT